MRSAACAVVAAMAKIAISNRRGLKCIARFRRTGLRNAAGQIGPGA
jgi:hypothetical protein